MITYNGYNILWNIIGASQGSNALPIGTILPYIGALDKLPHGWAVCDGSHGTPDLRDRFMQGSDAPGRFMDAGLPNIRGKLSTGSSWQSCRSLPPLSSSGAFSTSSTKSYDRHGGTGINDVTQSYIEFDASRYNSIYGNSNTVQPASYTVYYIIRMI